jgi:hypothetical protein
LGLTKPGVLEQKGQGCDRLVQAQLDNHNCIFHISDTRRLDMIGQKQGGHARLMWAGVFVGDDQKTVAQ